MAEDARISTEFPAHYKTKKVRRRLGIEGCWHLMCLFLWAAANRPEGDLSGMSDEDIEIACGWEGKVGELVSTLVEVGYLDGEQQHRLIHDWAIHNVYAATRHKRVEAAKRAISIRWSKRTGNVGNTDGIRTVNASNENAIPSSPLLSSPPISKQHISPKESSNRATRIPPDFCVTDAHRDFAAKHDYVDPDTEIHKFIDHFKSKPGKDGTSLDWNARFRVWLSKAQQYSGVSNGQDRPINRGRARFEAQRMELQRAEEMDQARTLGLSGDDEGNYSSRGPKQIRGHTGGNPSTSASKSISAVSNAVEILSKTSRIT